ncbi:hypothetical protein [Brockia lithotrophica]|uniref:Uncharacterized protein n=1 Tax=Brockia lithotrophica TaxID=933949 RepID=A0A660L463_9BACL|nr:hypothetical protein [Brockia lithotrophica]RKQ88811.1 hypothetical protein C7438_0454 [Brockia lithotrophica]
MTKAFAAAQADGGFAPSSAYSLFAFAVVIYVLLVIILRAGLLG